MLPTVLLGVTLAVSSDSVVPDEPLRPTWSLQGEYVVWWLRRGYAPPILTTSSPASQGILGRPDTDTIYGDELLHTRHNNRFIGARLALEWQPPGAEIGIEGRAFFLERDSTYHTFYTPDGSLLMALSYIDAQTGQETSEVVAGFDRHRGLLSGGFVGYSRIELFGQEINLVHPLLGDADWKVDLLAGVRFLQMRDRYHHTATSRILPEGAVLYGVVDNYRIHNAFYGGQLGLRGECWLDRWFVQMRGAVALGADIQRVRTFGNRVFHTPQIRIETPVGLFVQPSNTGDVRRSHFDVVAEAAVNLGYALTDHVRVFVGYTLLYWADPLRAANQVDRVVNLHPGGQGPARPGLPFNGDMLWAHGMNIGLEFRW